MNNVLMYSKRFLKRNSSTILTYVGAAGVVVTAVMAVKATPKALKLLDKAEEEKGEKLTKIEVLKVAGPAYIPSILIGGSTIACVIGANVLNKHQQAALMSAYALLDSSYKEYKAKVSELYGEDVDSYVREEIAKDHYTEGEFSPEGDIKTFYDEYSNKYFEATMEDVLRAEYILNRDLSYHGYACLNDFYKLLNLPETPYGDILGWASTSLYMSQWHSWVDFNHKKVPLEDGLSIYILEILTEPIPNYEEDC